MVTILIFNKIIRSHHGKNPSQSRHNITVVFTAGLRQKDERRTIALYRTYLQTQQIEFIFIYIMCQKKIFTVLEVC